MQETFTLTAALAVADAGTASETGTSPGTVEDLFAEHGGSDRNGDAYPVASPRYTYTVGSGNQALVRAATSDIIHNQAGFDNVHLQYTGPGAYSGGQQYVEGTVSSLDTGGAGGVPELYIRQGSTDNGTAVYLATNALQLFDWGPGGFTGITSEPVSLSVGGPHTWWIAVTSTGGISAGVLGLGVLIAGVTPAQSGVRTNGGRGFGWFRPTGAGPMPITRILFGSTRPAYVE